MTLRVATWNIWGRFGDFRGRYPAITSTLRSVSADLVGLVEIWWDDSEDQVERMASDLGYPHWATAQIGLVEDQPWGVGILSRLPISDHERLAFELAVADRCPGVALVATVEGEDGPFDFVSMCEWSDGWCLGADGHDRLSAYQSLTAKLVERGRKLPPFLVGDLNSTPESRDIRALTGKEPQLGLAMNFYDSWEYAHGSQTGWTVDGFANPHLAEDAFGKHRIDYVMAGTGLGFDRVWRVTEARVFGQVTGPAGPPSDHYGVVADFELVRPVGAPVTNVKIDG